MFGCVDVVCSKLCRRGTNSNGLDPYLYGLHTLPPGFNGGDYYDGASVGACSRTRSQRDLCQAGIAQWPSPGRECPPGTYATTLEMQRIGSAPNRYAGYPRLPQAGGSQLTLPDVWAAPCPLHGTYGRRHPIHHIYNVIDTEHDGALMPAPGDGNPVSPFYHELDGQILGLDAGPTPPPRPDGLLELPGGDCDPNSAPFAKI